VETRIVWYVIMGAMTLAFAVALMGLRQARGHAIGRHAVLMAASAGMVLIWLVSYLAKQILFGRETFGGPEEIYYGLYIPLFIFHMLCAAVTLGLWGFNLHHGIRFLREKASNAQARPWHGHRLAGRMGVLSFGVTLVTAYLVYLMLFAWYPGGAELVADGSFSRAGSLNP